MENNEEMTEKEIKTEISVLGTLIDLSAMLQDTEGLILRDEHGSVVLHIKPETLRVRLMQSRIDKLRESLI